MVDNGKAVDSERLASMEPQAILANRFYVVVGPAITRIAFAEALLPEGDPKYRTAIVLETSDAKALADTILSLLAKAGG